MNVLTDALARTGRDKLAALFTFIRGAGHLLKGRKKMTLVIMTVGNLAMVVAAAALVTAHCAGMGMLLALSEASKVHDPHFYQGVRQEDSGEFSMAKGKRAVTPARPPEVRLNPS
jgi:hypothetical protein